MTARASVRSNQYLFCPSIRYIHALCKKSASSALLKTLFDLKQPSPTTGLPKIEKDEARSFLSHGYTCAMFVRHPYDRFVSGYEFFLHRMPKISNERYPGRSVQFWYEQHGLPGPGQFSFEQWAIAALGVFPHDKHVAPQSPEHRDEHGLLPQIIWPLDDSAAGWQHIRQRAPGLPAELVVKNQTTEVSRSWEPYFDSLTDATRERVEQFYEGDIAFYADACKYRDDFTDRNAPGAGGDIQPSRAV